MVRTDLSRNHGDSKPRPLKFVTDRPTNPAPAYAHSDGGQRIRQSDTRLAVLAKLHRLCAERRKRREASENSDGKKLPRRWADPNIRSAKNKTDQRRPEHIHDKRAPGECARDPGGDDSAQPMPRHSAQAAPDRDQQIRFHRTFLARFLRIA